MASLSILIFHPVFCGGSSTCSSVGCFCLAVGTAMGLCCHCTHVVPGLAAKLQPEVLLLHQVEVAAGEVKQPSSTGFLLVSKHSREAAG